VALACAGCGAGSTTTQTVTITQGAPSGDTESGSSSGSSAPAQTSSSPQQLQVAGGGFSDTVSDGQRTLNYVALIKNPNTTRTFDQAEVDLDFLSARGTVVASEEEFANYILPNATMAVVGDDVGIPPTHISKLQIRVSTPYDWIPVQTPPAEFTTKIASFHAATSYGTYELKATVGLKSTFSKPVTKAAVALVYYNGKGKIIGGDNTWANLVPAHGKALVTFDDFPGLPVAHVRAFASLDNISQIGNQSLS
jgi:hypothetical protein